MSISWAKRSLKKGEELQNIKGTLAVQKFNNEKSKFANYLAEIWGAIWPGSERQRRKPGREMPAQRCLFCVRKTFG
jgi:hypothetical protein